MSQRRNWEKARRESKVETKGALPISAPHWDSDNAPVFPKPGPVSDDLKAKAMELLASNIFCCGGRYLRLTSSREEFASFNEIAESDPRFEAWIQNARAQLGRDLSKFASFLAKSDPSGLVSGYVNIEEEYKRFVHFLGRRPSFFPSSPPLLPPRVTLV